MTWSIEFLEEAEKDMKKLDYSAQIQVLRGIRKDGYSLCLFFLLTAVTNNQAMGYYNLRSHKIRVFNVVNHL